MAYPTGHDVKTSTTGMSPEMEAKFLWLLDQVQEQSAYPFGYNKEQWDALPQGERLRRIAIRKMELRQMDRIKFGKDTPDQDGGSLKLEIKKKWKLMSIKIDI